MRRRQAVIAVGCLQGMGAQACGYCDKVKATSVLSMFDQDLGVRICLMCSRELWFIEELLESVPGIRGLYEEEMEELRCRG